jgi:myotubularin-related protein 9
MTGTGNRRCKEDESILGKSLPSGKKGVIFDTRDLNLAKAASYKGGGYESDSHYPLWKRYYINLERYDQLHTSFSKLIEACNESSLTNDKWLSKLESSNWLNNVRQSLYVACCVADEIYNKNSCVIKFIFKILSIYQSNYMFRYLYMVTMELIIH